ncbi:hypothetical protein L861_23130 [Litchfieldella anticariensis FP35 = DSM 16096]|uniref:Guanylate kinase-like domain-containing protein n=1 Tax=Litchfieldella anticariensis (strain DSM 16096 / CECT 5854 / CIP 108499 / LMG 22089 / FP35) TaxID=1121939 RepID=S2KMQ6_LITA3|nr:hypothetical protein [Halomonas anticariensis]EPC03205.1 hypothetical protein L861_23130 [Halomonas anticariensis FP35 = DSM 16096]
MPIFIFIVGVRGAGKTTLIESIKENSQEIRILRPTTTRSRRNPQDAEYDFVDSMDDEENYLWVINVGREKYGVHKREVNGLNESDLCICPFDPGSYHVLKDFRGKNPGRVVTVGLDTIDNIDKQKERVSFNNHRVMGAGDFIAQLDIVKRCDVVLSGEVQSVFSGVVAIIDCLIGKGGVLIRRQIEPLLKCNSLLKGSTSSSSIASYDLRLGDDVWCQGKYISLSKNEPTLKIPPYSYAIVSAMEQANLPSFVSARFDLKNSLFFNGVILSNGPQVDPGYRGALFCMLYNGSDQPVGVTRGKHFSTIEFHTTCGLSDGYDGKYQNKTSLSDFIPESAAVSEGGRILERTQEKIGDVKKEWGRYKNGMAVLVPIFFTALFFFVQHVTDSVREASSIVEKRSENLDKRLERLIRLEVMLDEENVAREKSMPEEIGEDEMRSVDEISQMQDD